MNKATDVTEHFEQTTQIEVPFITVSFKKCFQGADDSWCQVKSDALQSLAAGHFAAVASQRRLRRSFWGYTSDFVLD